MLIGKVPRGVALMHGCVDLKTLPEEWIASFPEVRLNLVAGSTGNWLCWALLRGFGTVLWRSVTAPGNRIDAMAYRAAQLPLIYEEETGYP